MARPLSSGFLAVRLIAAADASPWEIALFHSTTPMPSPIKNSARPTVGVIDTFPAISPLRIAESLGAQFLAHDIQDRRDNVTRFIGLSRAESPPTGDDKTSFCFGFAEEDRSGTLVDALRVLAEAKINMTKLESRPAKEILGQYIFLVDINGHRRDSAVAAALERIQRQTGLFKVFGSYPCWRAKG